MKTANEQPLPKTGFFVDWNGDTRRIEAPGDPYSCTVEDCGGQLQVAVVDTSGLVVFEADFHRSIASIEARGVEVRFAGES